MTADKALRERLAEALYRLEWQADLYATPRNHVTERYERRAARLLPLIHAERDKARAEVAEREWAERFLVAWSAPYFGPDPQDAVAAVQRAARDALDGGDPR